MVIDSLKEKQMLSRMDAQGIPVFPFSRAAPDWPKKEVERRR